jgi:hypothetical protein
MDSEKPFREEIRKKMFFGQIPVTLEIKDSGFPSVFFEKSPLLIPSIAGKVEAPIISVERRPGRSDIAKTINRINEQLGIENKNLDEFPFLNTCIADAKEYYIKQDLQLLVNLVARYFDHELKSFRAGLDNIPDDMMQIVEIDFTMIELSPGDTEIHYRLYTKRGIRRGCMDEPIKLRQDSNG